MPSVTNADVAFWDTSALALLCTHQRATGDARRIVQRCKRIGLWWGSPVEATSAFMRLFREGIVSSTDLGNAKKKLAVLLRSAIEVLPTEDVRSLATSALHEHELRAGDAFQLAAALVLCHERPRGRWFVCFDGRLANAADIAGFTVLPTRG